MKRTLILICTIGTLLATKAQSYEQGTLLINAGTGFGIETTTSNIPDDSSDNAAVPGLLNLSVEYGITDKLGVMVRGERNGYVRGENDSATAVSYNYMIGPAFHFKNGDKTSFYINALFGMSSFKFTDTSPDGKTNDRYVKGSGFCWQGNVGMNIYLGEKLGIFFEAGYAGRNYSKLTAHDTSADPTEQDWVDDKGTVDESDDENITLGLSGVDIRAGLTFKL